MSNKEKRTSIMVHYVTRDRLADIGKKKETYEDIINRLVDHYHNFTINGKGKNKK